MKFVFYDIGIYGKIIQRILCTYLGLAEGEDYFSSVMGRCSGPCPHVKCLDGECYIIFYMMALPGEPERMLKFVHKNRMNAKIVALCRDSEEGIRAMGNGSDYALRIPLEQERIIRCYEHLA